MNPLEAYEVLASAPALQERLSAALAKHGPELKRERDWLQSAIALVHEHDEANAALFERARWLPELEHAREELAAPMQEAWVNAVEKLLAGITFVHGSRAPIVEALFP